MDRERRDWDNQIKTVPRERRKSLSPTRRYLLVVDHQEIARVIKKEFSIWPNAVYPHESRKDFLFYCVTDPSCEKISSMVSAIFHKLKKSNISSAELDEVEVLTA